MNAPQLNLSVTPFEWYMLEDDSQSYPMVFTVHFLIEGDLHLEEMRQAFVQTLHSHPLLASRAVIAGDGARYRWDIEPNPQVAAFTHAFSGPNELTDFSHRIDPCRGPNSRLVLCRLSDLPQRKKQYLLAFRFHHAVTDGIGSFEFCSDVFQAYLRMVKKESEEIFNGDRRPRRVSRKALSPALLPDRGLLDRRIPHPVKPSTAYYFLAKEVAKFLFLFPARIRSIRSSKALPQPPTNISTATEIQHFNCETFLGVQCDVSGFEVSPEIVDILRRFAQEHEATLNHILLAATFRAFGAMPVRWSLFAHPWVAVLPVNMRRPTTNRIPAHNGIGYAFVRRSKIACLDWRGNFPTLKTELDAVQDWKLAGLFVDALAYIRSLPRWIARRIVRSMCPGSFVWSYIGDPFRRFPDKLVENDQLPQLDTCEITNFFGAPPTRNGTETAILVTLWKDSIRLWFRFDRKRVSSEQSLYVRQAIANEIVRLAKEVQSHSSANRDLSS